jgi:hypothetical protein
MSETKSTFDSIPLDGPSVGVIDPPRPSFSRSVPDVSTAGLLPPTRKPVAVTVPELPVTPPVEAAEPNPMASTPPPKAGSLRGFLWDLVRPTRTKWAILAGGASLVAGAYGLNLVVPTPTEPPKKAMPEQERLLASMAGGPQVFDERQRPPQVDEHRVPAVTPRSEPTPLAPFPAPTPTPVVPLPDPSKIIIPARNEEPAPVPIKPVVNDPPPGGPLPVPVALDQSKLPSVPALTDKAEPVMPAPLPALKPEDLSAAPIPVPRFNEKTDPVVPATPAPKPAAFTELPDPATKAGSLPVPVDMKPLDVVPLPERKVTPVADPKPVPLPVPTGLPPVGGLVSDTKADKPAEAVPLPKPVPVDPKPLVIEMKPPDVVPVAEKKPELIPTPVFKEEKPLAVPVTVGAKDPPAAVPVGGPPPKKGFEVDVVKVRANDTYTSISEAFYQSRKYATALRAFNGDVDISRLQEVEVPPLFELQKVSNTAREAEPTGRTAMPARGGSLAEPPVRGPVIEPAGDAGESVDWGPVGKRRPVTKFERFTTPKEGMTARDVARAVYADENEWAKLIGPRGAKLRADDPLPRGTELTVPREELPWK